MTVQSVLISLTALAAGALVGIALRGVTDRKSWTTTRQAIQTIFPLLSMKKEHWIIFGVGVALGYVVFNQGYWVNPGSVTQPVFGPAYGFGANFGL